MTQPTWKRKEEIARSYTISPDARSQFTSNRLHTNVIEAKRVERSWACAIIVAGRARKPLTLNAERCPSG